VTSPEKQGFVVALGRRFSRNVLKVIEESEVWLACRESAISFQADTLPPLAKFTTHWSAVEPIPKYRRYHRPIVHLPSFCSDDTRQPNSIGIVTIRNGRRNMKILMVLTEKASINKHFGKEHIV
jgi:hypothetical protein